MVEDGGNGIFKDDILEGIAGGFLFVDFGEEIIGAIFGFPKSEGTHKSIDERAVGADVAAGIYGLGRMFFDQLEFAAAGKRGEQGAEGATRAAFVRNIAQFGECFVVFC